MAKVAVPIIKLKYRGDDAYPNEIHEVFEAASVWSQNEDFTFTGRVSLTKGSLSSNKELKAKREEILEELKKVFIEKYGETEWEKPYKRFVKLLNKNDWDVSFYVDCY